MPLTTKRCVACESEKPLSDFHRRSVSPDGRHYYCKSCRRDMRLKRYEPHRKKPILPDGLRRCGGCMTVKPIAEFANGGRGGCKDCAAARQLKYLYGITVAEYEALLAAQGGQCGICGVGECLSGQRFSVDHDHSCCPKRSCGKCVRGLLCRHCNAALGLFRDSPELLARAQSWLRPNGVMKGPGNED